MQDPQENSEEQLNDLRIENEIKKIKLSLEHGGNFSALNNTGLPPEVESQWLDYIQQFEDEFAKRKTILVYDFVGRPEFIPVEQVNESDIKAELERMQKILNDHAVVLDTICEVNDRELYRFITEELFKEETNDMHIEGMRTCFIYEEFHPNHEHDITSRCTEFINQVMDKDEEWMPKFLSLSEEVNTTLGIITEQEAIRKIEYFRDSFSYFTLDNFIVNTIALNDTRDEAEVTFDIDYKATLEGSIETMQFSGIGVFSMKIKYEWWTICMVRLPGLII